MDPFKYLPAEVCDSILQYLTGKEILEASKVSKTWHSIIGESSKIMQKIQLNLCWLIGPHRLTEEMECILIDSHRKYQNVVMKYQSLHIDGFMKILESNGRQWKNVKIERIVFNSSAELMDMMEIIKDTVEELEIEDVYVKQANRLEPLKFPKLKVLKLINVEIFQGVATKIFVNCTKLKELHITSNDCSTESIESTKKILKNNHNLKHLEITSQIFSSVLDNEISFKFKLVTFISTNYCDLKFTVDYRKFLQNQFGYIKNISMDDISCLDTLKLIFQMPNLKSLNLGNIDISVMYLSDIHLNVNKTIEKLSYRDLKRELNIMKSLLEALPNVKDIEMFTMTQDMMEHLSSTAKHLEALKLRTLDAKNLNSKELFPKLKKVHVEILSAEMETNLFKIPVDDTNPLVVLLKDSNYTVLH